MKSLEKELESIRYKSFGKVKYRDGMKSDKRLDQLYVKKEACVRQEDMAMIDDEIVIELKRARKENLEKKVNNLLDTKRNKGTCAAVFRLKEDVVGKKSMPKSPLC